MSHVRAPVMTFLIALSVIAALATAAPVRPGIAPHGAPAAADGHDWLQWGGPGRDFKTDATGLTDSFASGGPPLLWARDLGEGYSAIVVEGDRLYTMYRLGNRERVIAMSATTGETLWEYGYGASVRRLDTAEGMGPHASPLIVGDRLFTVGIVGDFHAFDKNDGTVLWSHNLWQDFRGTFRPRGYSSSPIAYGDDILMLVGGRGQAVMAFDQADGSVAWRGGDFNNAQSSPLIIDVDGQEQLVAFMVDFVAGFDPTNGELLWRHTHRTDYGLNITTPVWGDDNVLFVSSAYNGGSTAVHLSLHGQLTEVRELWATNRMRVHFGTAMRIGDYVYGSSGDFGPSFLSAIDANGGSVVWRDRAFAKVSFVYADGKLVVLDEDGDLGLVTVSGQGMEVLARARVFDSRSWTGPTLVGTTVYVRNHDEIKAFDLSAVANADR